MQLVGLRIPNLNGDLSTPLFKTVYLGHPAASKFDGLSLAQDLLKLCQDYGLDRDILRKGLCGGVFDGQYLHLKVLEHLGILNFEKNLN